MKKHNQNGFGLIEGLLIVLILAVAGFGGYTVWRNQHKTTSGTTATSQTTNSYVGWKEYKSSDEGFSFKYPPSWKLVHTGVDKNGMKNENIDAIALEGPNNFSIGYDVYSLLDQVAAFTCGSCKFTVLSSVDLNLNSVAYIIVNSNNINGETVPEEQELSLSGWQTYSEQSDQGWPYYKSLKDPNKVVRWSGVYSESNCGPAGCGAVLINYNDFINRDEVKTAIQILKTVHY